MNKFTKKYMTEDYERLYAHSSLLDLYLWDTQNGAHPDAVEQRRDKNGEARIELWRAKSASGGYVIINTGMPNIWYLDDAVAHYADNHSEHTLALRICLERLTVARNKMYSASLGRPLMESEAV